MGKEKTVLHGLLESIEDYRHESHSDSVDIDKLKEVIINEYLELEKQQMINFTVERFKKHFRIMTDRKPLQRDVNHIIVTSENLYNEKYVKQ